MNQTAFVIMCNDYPQFVILNDKEFAENKKNELMQKDKNSKSYLFEGYIGFYWHIEEVSYERPTN